MRIAFVTQSSAWSGTEVHTLELAALMAQRGHAVTIVEGGQELYSKKVSDRQIAVRVTSMPMRYASLRSLRADLGVLVKGNFNIGSAIGDAVHRLAFPRFVTIEHLTQTPLPPRPAMDAARLRPQLGLWWYRDAARRRARSLFPQLTICVADAVKARLVSDSGFSASRLVTAHNGIDPNRFRRDDDQRRDMRARWGIRADALVFGSVGRLSPMKNLEVAIQGFRELIAPGNRPLALVLAGEGPERSALEAAARAHGIAERVVFAGVTENPAAVYSALDVFVMPSVNEGLPFALLEAMSCGCAPIATDVGGIPEVIAGQEIGWLVPQGHRPRFIEAMRAAAAMPTERLAEVGAAARRRVLEQFNASVQYGVVADLLERSAGRAPDTGRLDHAATDRCDARA